MKVEGVELDGSGILAWNAGSSLISACSCWKEVEFPGQGGVEMDLTKKGEGLVIHQTPLPLHEPLWNGTFLGLWLGTFSFLASSPFLEWEWIRARRKSAE